jgi:hypothetical protein
MSNRTHKTTITFHVEREEVEIELRIEGRYHPGDPGQTFGPPENCYPSEPAEAEVEALWMGGHPWAGTLTDEEEEAVIEALIVSAEESISDGPDPDDDYDSRMERDDDYREDSREDF